MSVTMHALAPEVVTPEAAWLAPFFAPPLAKGWDPVEDMHTANGRGWRNRGKWIAGVGLLVQLSGAVELDGRRWVHVSCSRRDRMPSYEDLCLVKRLFIGRDRKALQVFVPEAEHFNFHAFCLHLWHCVDGDGLPDFRAQGAV